MLIIELSALHWQSSDDFYADLLAELGAPSWHGRNLDAINDSIFGGSINEVSPPFRIVIRDTAGVSADLQTILRTFQTALIVGRQETAFEASVDIV